MKLKNIIGLGLSFIMAVSNQSFCFAQGNEENDVLQKDKIVSGAAIEIEKKSNHDNEIDLVATYDTTYAVEGGNIYFDSSTGTITDCDTAVTSAVIPETINGVKVTSIGNYAFYYCNVLTSINIPNSVTSISDYAFGIGLTSINIPNSVTSISDYAFYSCDGLISINVENNNKNYTSVNGVLFNKDKTTIMRYPIGSKNKNYEVPNGIIFIGNYAFSHCGKLTSVSIPNSVTSIGTGAFSYCERLTNVNIPNSVTSIRSGAFAQCERLTSVTIPNSVTSIGPYAFSCCSRLTNITIPNSVTSIESSTFSGCSGLTNITIPDSVASIGNEAFAECKKLTSITIPNSVTSIGIWAFKYCNGLTSVSIPNSVTSIEDYTFFGCNELTGITIPNSVVSIGKEVFYNCDKLIIYCHKDSYAEIYAKQHSIKYVLIDENITSKPKTNAINSVIMTYYGVNYNLLTSKHSFVKDSEEEVTIYANVDWGNSIPGKIYLTQDAKTNIESADGNFSNIKPGKIFKPSDTIYIAAMDSSGKIVESRRIYLQITEPVTSGSTTGKNKIKLFDAISFTIPDDKPVFGDQKFKLDLGAINFDLDSNLEEGTFKGIIGLNAKKDEDGHFKIKDFKTLKNVFKEARKKVQKGAAVNDFHAIYKANGVENSNNFEISSKWKPSGQVCGYIEGKMIDGKPVISEGGLILTAELSYTYEGQAFIAFIPVYYSIGAGGKVTVSLGVKDLVGNDAFVPKFTGNVEIAPYGEIGGGIGVVYLGQVGARGKATLTFHIALDQNYQKVDLTGQAYFEIKALSFTLYEREFAKGTWTIWENGRSKSTDNDVSLSSVNDIYGGIDINAKVKPEARNYIYNSSEWLGDKNDTITLSEYTNKEQRVLQTNAYPNAQPQIIKSNGTNVMLWLADNTERDSYNKSMLVYSVYNSSADTWSKPKAVMNNGRADYYPSAKDGYVVWQKATRTYTEKDTLADVAKDTEIYVSSFNGETFDTPVKITDNNIVDTQPHIVVNGKTAVIVWTQNNENNILGISGKNSIYKSEFDGSLWSEPICIAENLNIVASLDIGYMNDSFVTVYSLDTDNNINSIEDREIYIIRNGSVTPLTNNNVIDSNPKFEKLNGNTVLFWYNKNNLTYITDLDNVVYNTVTVDETSQLSDEYSIISKGNKTVVLWTSTTDGISEVYGSLYDGKQWSNDVKITSTEQSARYPNGVIDDDGKLIIAFNRIKNVADGDYYKDGQSDLCVINVTPSYDLSISDVLVGNDIKPKSNVPVYLSVTNTGELPVNNINVEILDIDGTQNYNYNFTETLQPGEIAEIEAVYTTGETIIPGNITVKVSTSDGKEENFNNNSETVAIGLSDIEIGNINISKKDKNYKISVDVKNIGYTDVSNVDIMLSTDSDGEDVVSKQFAGNISAQSKTTVVFEVNSEDIESSEENVILNAIALSTDNEVSIGNNYKGFILEETPEYKSVYGDVDDVKGISVNDAACVLQKVLNDSNKLPIEEYTDEWIIYADVDGDKKLTAKDAAIILQKALNSNFTMPVEVEK